MLPALEQVGPVDRLDVQEVDQVNGAISANAGLFQSGPESGETAGCLLGHDDWHLCCTHAFDEGLIAALERGIVCGFAGCQHRLGAFWSRGWVDDDADDTQLRAAKQQISELSARNGVASVHHDDVKGKSQILVAIVGAGVEELLERLQLDGSSRCVQSDC